MHGLIGPLRVRPLAGNIYWTEKKVNLSFVTLFCYETTAAIMNSLVV